MRGVLGPCVPLVPAAADAMMVQACCSVASPDATPPAAPALRAAPSWCGHLHGWCSTARSSSPAPAAATAKTRGHPGGFDLGPLACSITGCSDAHRLQAACTHQGPASACHARRIGILWLSRAVQSLVMCAPHSRKAGLPLSPAHLQDAQPHRAADLTADCCCQRRPARAALPSLLAAISHLGVKTELLTSGAGSCRPERCLASTSVCWRGRLRSPPACSSWDTSKPVSCPSSVQASMPCHTGLSAGTVCVCHAGRYHHSLCATPLTRHRAQQVPQPGRPPCGLRTGPLAVLCSGHTGQTCGSTVCQETGPDRPVSAASLRPAGSLHHRPESDLLHCLVMAVRCLQVRSAVAT